ncbi:NAD(P)/FAD-dependent oxidoreductase [Sphingopyxis sp. DBS4]|uniref:flavin-containing monooxygenase n=1 Tax=Sphingopyxis sp. DBS4 TaxID=2968500 RepID=UPI00214BB669|nr:NAD(P)/FAD-dependent oxidoreductase [Sphingopyxis sp. DBS4]
MDAINLADVEEAEMTLEQAREKYRRERDKRVRSDGESQYIEPSGEFAHYVESDPYADPDFHRDPVDERPDVAIIGGGFSGMLAAARLKEQGIENFRIIEAGADFGGTWYWNRYPGAQCDVESYCYLPLLEELNYIPKEKYSYVTEIFEHSQRIGRSYGLYDKTLFQTRVRAIRWNEEISRWEIETNRNDVIQARFVIMALGTTTRAKLPGIPGIETFEGKTFHTTRWDYEYTGGDTNGNLHKLADKRVALIGTGATSVQVVPHLGRDAAQLYVFQRTPSSVDLRGNKETDPDWAAGLQPGWQDARRENFGGIMAGSPFEEDLVYDRWTDVFHRLQAAREHRGDNPITPEEQALEAELVDLEKMNELRARIDETVQDPETAERLKPWYRHFCKRPCFSDNYLPTFNRPNVTLVDTSQSQGVERITKNGVVANGKEYEVDCIIYATGFEISSKFRRRLGIEIFGRNGKSLYDHWEDGFRTLHGFSTNGFPNWFYIGFSQNALSFNMTAMFDGHARHIAYIISEVKKRGADTTEPSEEAQDAWVAEIRRLAFHNEEYLAACTPGYYNNEGKPRGGLNEETYSPGINAFNALLEEWRDEGNLAGLIIAKKE